MLARAASLLVRLYQILISPLIGSRCRFHPSCSSYAIAALRTNGLVRGGIQTVWRLLRCGPWCAGGVDHPRKWRRVRDLIHARSARVG